MQATSRPSDRWPWWFAPAGFFGATAVAILAYGVLDGLLGALAGDGERVDQYATLAGTTIQDLAFLAVPFGLAAAVGAGGRRAFGLVAAPRRDVALAVLAGFVCFLGFAWLWGLVLGKQPQQETLDVLGTDDTTAQLVLSAMLIVGLAPVAEEVLFRGLCYPALRNRLGAILGALVVSAVFGAIHYTGPDTLSVVLPLAVLSGLFCLLYEKTGTLWAPIALHAVNNAVAFAATAGHDAAIPAAIAVGSVVLGVCARELQQTLVPSPAV